MASAEGDAETNGKEYRFLVRDRYGKPKGRVRVDASDQAAVMAYRWRMVKRTVTSAQVGSLGRYLLGVTSPAERVEHRNGDPLDYRRQNLVVRRYTSRHKGVSQNALSGKWQAFVRSEGKSLYLGRFGTEEEAAAAVTAWKQAHEPIPQDRPQPEPAAWTPKLTLEEPEAQPTCAVTACPNPVARKRLCAEHWAGLRERKTPDTALWPVAAAVAIPAALVWWGVRCWRRR